MTRILLLGADGQVGFELRRSLQCAGQVAAMSRAHCDLAAPDQIRQVLATLQPQLIVNAAAYTAVDRAETETVLAQAINADAPALLAAWAETHDAALIHYSTDYVFDGMQSGWATESLTTNPVSAYGRSKREGEQAVLASGAAALIFRTSWVYAARGRNFLRTMLQLARTREELRVVDDQFGAPTWARTVADATTAIVHRAAAAPQGLMAQIKEKRGIYHLVAAGETTWYGFAETIFAAVPDPGRKLQRLLAIPSEQYPTPARRPSNSRLDTRKVRTTWGIHLPEWGEAMRCCLDELTNQPA